MSKARAFFVILIAVILTGCGTTPLYESRDAVSIHLYNEPVVTHDSFSIHFRFEPPGLVGTPPGQPDDPHLIQWIDINNWTGVEAFRVLPDGKSALDHHFTGKGTSKQSRRITICPGKVEGVDETTSGFSMLPSGWPDEFNSRYRSGHKVQGRVVYRLSEKATVYRLDFADGKLVWSVEGTDVRREWSAEPVDTPSGR